MVRRLSLIVAYFLLFQIGAFSANDSELISLDAQRNELLKRITYGLVNGKIGINDAQRLKDELDKVVSIETRMKENAGNRRILMKRIKNILQQSRAHIDMATHSQKVWMGIDSENKAFDNKISNALQSGKINKTQADGLMEEVSEIKARESNGDPSQGFEFTDAIALAKDMQSLNNKIDRLIAGK